MEIKSLDSKIIAREYLKEINYLREVEGQLNNSDYRNKRDYIDELRRELFNRGFFSYCDIVSESNK